MITNDIYINLLEVIPTSGELNNVVARVNWTIIFTDGEFVSKGGGITVLNIDNISSFTPVDQLTEAQVAGWVNQDLEDKGFKQEITAYHTAAINDQIAKKSLVVWSQPLLEQKTRPTESSITISE